MIEFFTAATPNGYKIAVMLEECALPYTTHLLTLSALEQKWMFAHAWSGLGLEGYSSLQRLFDLVDASPGVKRGISVPPLGSNGESDYAKAV